MIGTIVKLEGAQALLERLVERPERLKIFTSVQFYRELVIVYTNFNDSAQSIPINVQRV